MACACTLAQVAGHGLSAASLSRLLQLLPLVCCQHRVAGCSSCAYTPAQAFSLTASDPLAALLLLQLLSAGHVPGAGVELPAVLHLLQGHHKHMAVSEPACCCCIIHCMAGKLELTLKRIHRAGHPTTKDPMVGWL